MSQIVMFDTVTLSTVPKNPVAVAGYVGGSWPTYDSLVTAFPHAFHMSIAVNAFEYAHSLDIERWDATPDQGPGWVKRFFRGPGKPVLYTSASSVNDVIGYMERAGYKRSDFLIWSAHYSGRAHICAPGVCGWPQADGTQWTSTAFGTNLDESLVSSEFFGPSGPPPDPHHYERYADSPITFEHGAGVWHKKLVLNERATVREYDNRMKNPPKKGSQSDIRIRYVLRPQIKILRDRIWTIANKLDPEPGGRASWAVGWRGWKWQKLNDRLTGPVKVP